MKLDARASDQRNLDNCATAVDDGENSDDESSVASNGSEITLETESPNTDTSVSATTYNNLGTVTPSTAPAMTPAMTSRVPVCTIDTPLTETPPEDRRKKRKKPEDCHILIRWSQLVSLVKDNFSCACGQPIKDFERRTIGIATEVDFHCTACKKSASALADCSEYVEKQSLLLRF
jgi:hypothetical protein